MVKAEVTRKHVEALRGVAFYPDRRHAWHVLSQPPIGLPFRDYPDVLEQHFIAIAHWRPAPRATVILAGWATDDAVKT